MLDAHDDRLIFRQQPINEDPPTETEKAASLNLFDLLVERGQVLGDEMTSKFEDVLFRVDNLVKMFVRDVAIKAGYDQATASTLSGKLMAFGSFRLGVASKDSDIDSVCLAPRFVKIEDFFHVFYRILLNNKYVSNLVKVERARVPIMTMLFDGIDIDISFAQLASETVEDSILEDIDDDSVVADVDQRTTPSLNGVRVNNMILKLASKLPEPENFKILLRFIRLWSKARGIYGNVYGYLGGVNCALLCLFICERYPKAAAATLVLMFFHDLMDWQWPEPIYVNTPSVGPKPSWDNSVGAPGRRDLMPILTPAYPAMNSLASATRSSRARMTAEFKRGYHLTHKVIFEGEPWTILLARSKFFTTYRKYVQVTAWADTKDNYNRWIGTLESRIRTLGQELESVRFMDGVYLWPEHFDGPDGEGHEFAGCFFIGIQYCIPEEESVQRKIDISEPCQKFINVMYDPKYRTEHMFMFVKLLSRSEMPDFVFPEGRPAR